MSTTPGFTLAAMAAVGPEAAVPLDAPSDKPLLGLDGVTGAAGVDGLAGDEGEAVFSVGRRPCQRHRLTTPATAPTSKETARAAARLARPHRAGGTGGIAASGGGGGGGGAAASQGAGPATHS